MRHEKEGGGLFGYCLYSLARTAPTHAMDAKGICRLHWDHSSAQSPLSHSPLGVSEGACPCQKRIPSLGHRCTSKCAPDVKRRIRRHQQASAHNLRGAVGLGCPLHKLWGSLGALQRFRCLGRLSAFLALFIMVMARVASFGGRGEGMRWKAIEKDLGQGRALDENKEEWVVEHRHDALDNRKYGQ